MSRSKTKGSTIGFRLPIEADAELRLRAEAAGLTPSAWVEKKLTEAIEKLMAGPGKPTLAAGASRDVEYRGKK